MTSGLRIKSFPEFSGIVAPSIIEGVKRVLYTAEKESKTKYFTGRPHLNVVTGRLKQSITHRVSRSGKKIIGRFGTNVEYGPVHEYGFHGPVPVRAHIRTITQAFGRKIKPTPVSVRAHTRQANIPARPFVGPPFEKAARNLRGEIIRAIKKRVK